MSKKKITEAQAEYLIKLAKNTGYNKAINDFNQLIFETCEPYFFDRTSSYTASDILNILTILRARTAQLKEKK